MRLGKVLKIIGLGLVLWVAAKKVNPSVIPAGVTVDTSRLINILGQVNRGILDKANELMALASQSRQPIFLLVNSPGGSVRSGNVFISAMNVVKSRGIQIQCITSVYAASMAFSILANCSTRYVLPKAQLLFHPVRVGLMGTLTGNELKTLADDLRALDVGLLNFLENAMGMNRPLLERTFYAEKWWDATELQAVTKKGWLTIIRDVKGIDDLFALEP